MDVAAFARKNGFIWGPEPELYGGVAGFYTYGPLGKLLKDNVEKAIRTTFRQNSFWEVETPIIFPEKVWQASGHLRNFVDPIIKCKKCKASFRPAKLIEEKHDVSADAFSDKQTLDFIRDKGIRCPSCNGDFLPRVDKYNLMMKTTIEQNKVAFNRPETATGTYLPFKNYYEFFRKKLPIRVFQIGKVFRNEVSPRQNVIRGREFTQAEAQMFIRSDEKSRWAEYNNIKSKKLPLWPEEFQTTKKKWAPFSVQNAIKKKWIASKAYAWCLHVAYSFIESLGFPADRIRIRQHTKRELAHYAADAWDIEVKTNSYGWVELVGVHDRQDYDLKQHSKASGQNLRVEGDFPHVLEIAFGSDRPTFALLDIFLAEDEVSGEKRTVLRLPKEVAPIKAAVFPLNKKDGLNTLANKIYADLSENFLVVYDEAGSIGKRYRRQDERGTPICITVDYQTKKDNTVTLRDRDTTKQKRVKISSLAKFI